MDKLFSMIKALNSGTINTNIRGKKKHINTLIVLTLFSWACNYLLCYDYFQANKYLVNEE